MPNRVHTDTSRDEDERACRALLREVGALHRMTDEELALLSALLNTVVSRIRVVDVGDIGQLGARPHLRLV